MYYSFEESKLDMLNHKFTVGDICVYEGSVYNRHIAFVSKVDSQSISSKYQEFLNPLNCRMATKEEKELLREANLEYILL